jgi:hypothetical protein
MISKCNNCNIEAIDSNLIIKLIINDEIEFFHLFV